MAKRNHGRVDLMRVVSTGHFVAVKVMPNSWVRSGLEEFAQHASGAKELPWFDIGLTRYLHEQGFQHVCEPLGIFRDQEFTYVSSTFCPGGEFFEFRDRGPSPWQARENFIRPIMLQVFSAAGEHLAGRGGRERGEADRFRHVHPQQDSQGALRQGGLHGARDA
jgi:hypothetical protein